MEQFATEEQQVEAIKRFWKENGIAIVVGAVLGLGGLWGYRYYQDSTNAAKEEASLAYQSAVEAIAEESGLEKLTAFATDNADTGYAVLAAFKLANKAVEDKKFEEAVKQLSFVQTSATDENLKAIASIRLARVQSELAQYDAALTSVNSVTLEAFSARVNEVKGDIYLAQKLYDKATAAYSEALDAEEGNRIVKMKLDSVAALANG